jgi:pimeloyl-ACP methyl ester carboxylesterase
LTCLVAWGGRSVARAADATRTLPPVGIAIPHADADRLSADVRRLAERIQSLRTADRGAKTLELLSDAEIFVKAVDYALRGNEFYRPVEIGWADEQLKLAGQRLDALVQEQRPWTTDRGLVVRGFRSRLDDSPQPYGLVIPKELDLARPSPLYVWLHGRGDMALDLQFIHARMTSPGQIRPAGAIVLHPFGRYCNGFKSAGEVDVFEAIEAVARAYRIDRDRIVLCGFSMGGAGVWHLGAHFPDRWAAMSPGAGFVDVRRYQNLVPEQFPPWYEQALWNVYDVPSYVRNLLNIPLIAYSGELDKQKQSADIMERALMQEGLTMTHIVGKGVAHKYEPGALADVLARLRVFEQRGIEHHPESIHFQTRTLRYGRCHWIELLGLGEHWRDARVDVRRSGMDRVEITTANVTGLRVSCPWPQSPTGPTTVIIDARPIRVDAAAWTQGVALRKTSAGWRLASDASNPESGLAKSPGLQGPIDDAFVEPFLVVRPTGRAAHPAVERWVAEEQARFVERWRTLFRGQVREVDDKNVTDDQMAKYNLLLWGDPSSNTVLARVVDRLPLAWDATSIRAPGVTWPSESHVLAMIYPNPLPSGRGRYVVLNSGMTFREAHDRTNSLQNPKLPDWAVFDLSVPPSDRSAGRVADAGFFDETWQYKSARSIPGD